MRESVTAFRRQIQLVDEREKRLIIQQKLLDFCAEGWVFLTLEEELETESVGFFKVDECLGATFRQSETNRRILRELFASFAPIFHQGDVRWALPTYFALKAVRHFAFEGFV